MPNTFYYDGTQLIIKDETGRIIATPAIGKNGIPVDQINEFIEQQGLVQEMPKEIPAPKVTPKVEEKKEIPLLTPKQPITEFSDVPPQEEKEEPSALERLLSGIKQALTPKEYPEKKKIEEKKKDKERMKKSEKQFEKTMGNEANQLKQLEEYLKQ